MAPAGLSPTADAYVRDGSSATTNFGTATSLQTGSSATAGNNRETYLKFDLTTVSGISSAKVRLYGGLSDTTSTNVPAGIFSVATTTWVESGSGSITWNTKPVSGATALASAIITDNVARWYEWDVTAYLQAEKAANRNVVSLVIKNTAQSSAFASFNSKETATNQPQLVLLSTQPRNALLVVGSTTLNTGDNAAKTRLQNLGYTVTAKAAGSNQNSAIKTSDADGKALVVISSTVIPANVTNKFRNVSVPVLLWEADILDDMGMTGLTSGTDFGTIASQTQLAITNPSHPMAAGLSGPQPVATPAATFTWGKPNANAVGIATLISDSTRLRKAADAFRIDRRIDDRHEQPGQREQIDRPTHTTGDADDETHEDASAEQRQHGLPLKAGEHPPAEKAACRAPAERRSRCCAVGQRCGRAGVAEPGQRRHPHVDRGFDADIQESPGREHQRVRAPHRAAGSAEAAVTGRRGGLRILHDQRQHNQRDTDRAGDRIQPRPRQAGGQQPRENRRSWGNIDDMRGVRRMLLLAGALSLGTACQLSSTHRIVGPDGSAMLHVSCGDDEGFCYALAGTHCPSGYEIHPAMGKRGNYLVRCVSYPPAGAWPAASGPTAWAPPVEPTAPPQEPPSPDGWPPLQSPNPSAVVAHHPPPATAAAPAPAASARAATSDASSSVRDRAADIDVGY